MRWPSRAALPVHATYGKPGLPELQVARLEENIAEKISRLNRTTKARDLYDLAWLATHQREIGRLAAAREQDRHLALRFLTELPGTRLAAIGLH
jgi:predicted nucleotidyltransferase component of viral defense system